MVRVGVCLTTICSRRVSVSLTGADSLLSAHYQGLSRTTKSAPGRDPGDTCTRIVPTDRIQKRTALNSSESDTKTL